MLGSNNCGKCSNYYLLLILCFALAGILLVMVLLILNLTVSVGTINGLIFFANVAKINEPAFFTNGPVPFLSQFISWINLDFGIESCFYNGLNAISKSWLQFFFPVYVWFLILLIIVLCKYSNSLSRCIGSNILPVCCQLFQSYSLKKSNAMLLERHNSSGLWMQMYHILHQNI